MKLKKKYLDAKIIVFMVTTEMKWQKSFEGSRNKDIFA